MLDSHITKLNKVEQMGIATLKLEYYSLLCNR